MAKLDFLNRYNVITHNPSIFTKIHLESLLEGAWNHLLSFVQTSLYFYSENLKEKSYHDIIKG